MRQKHASAVYMNGKPLSIAINSHRNDPRFVDSDTPYGKKSYIFSKHAEKQAIRRAGNVEGATLYVVRLAGSGPAMSAPCNYCMAEIINAGIKKVIYTTGAGIAVTRADYSQ